MKVKTSIFLILSIIITSLIIYMLLINQKSTSPSQKTITSYEIKNISTPWGTYPFKEVKDGGVPCLIEKGEYKAIKYITHPDIEGYIHATYLAEKGKYSSIISNLKERAIKCGYKLEKEKDNVFISSLKYKSIKSHAYLFKKEGENPVTLIISAGVVKINDHYFTIIEIDYQKEDTELKEAQNNNEL